MLHGERGEVEKEHKVSTSKDAQVEKPQAILAPPDEAEDGDKVVVAQLGSHPTAQLLSPYLCLQGGQNRQLPSPNLGFRAQSGEGRRSRAGGSRGSEVPLQGSRL